MPVEATSRGRPGVVGLLELGLRLCAGQRRHRAAPDVAGVVRSRAARMRILALCTLRFRGPLGDAQRGPDLLVAESLDVVEDEGGAASRRQRLDGPLESTGETR